MENPETAQFPLLDIFGFRLSGIALPISLGIWLLISWLPHGRHNNLRSWIARDHIRVLVAVSHLIGCLWSVWEIIHQQQAGATGFCNHALVTLEFITLTWGEGVLQESNFWAYTFTSWGWILLILRPFATTTFRPAWYPWLSLMLSLPCAFKIGGRVSLGAVISGVSLICNASFQLYHRSRDPTRHPGTVIAVLVPLCSAMLVRMAYKKLCSRDWFTNLSKHWLKPKESHIQCVQVGVAVIGLQSAGWIASSFLWSCFRWRWLLFGHRPSPPTITVFSLAGGALYFSIYALRKMLQNRAPTADATVFVQGRLKDCVLAVLWTNSVCLAVWLLYESASISAGMYSRRQNE